LLFSIPAGAPGFHSPHAADVTAAHRIRPLEAAREYANVKYMIEIDGSYGEGGGQILRTALSLSCLSGMPFRIAKIRRSRKKPGLQPQHLTCVRAAQAISGAQVAGDRMGSAELVFSPGRITGGDYSFDVGTAGSTLLVLQALLPPLLFSEAESTITLTGGTHVPFSPSYHYVAGVFLPVLARLGLTVHLSIDAYGFYPRGGGKIRAEIRPADKILPLRIPERGRLREITGFSSVGRLPGSIAERQRKAAVEAIRSGIGGPGPGARIELLDAPSPGRGTFLFLRVETENSVAGFTALGAIGKSAEKVGEEAARHCLDYSSTGAALDPNLPDQIVPYLSRCPERSEFTTSRITQHLLTNLRVTGLFQSFPHLVQGTAGEPGRVTIN
jgi:RNA 3'-terminal phosphate cyclase (ATP)